jgi:hypothetical protein
MIHPNLRFLSIPMHSGKRSALLGLAASTATALATTLTGGEARALQCNFGGFTGAPFDCLLNTDYQSNPSSDKIIRFLTLPTTGAGVLRFEYENFGQPGNYAIGAWQAIVNFVPSLNSNLGTGVVTGLFDYKVTVTDPNWAFKSVSLDSIIATPGTSIGKTLWEDAILGTNQIANLTSVNGAFVGPAPISGKTIFVRDTWTLQEGAALNQINNTYRQTSSVPGPLPLLGAGTAFGFSRKLRRRIRGAHPLSQG